MFELVSTTLGQDLPFHSPVYKSLFRFLFTSAYHLCVCVLTVLKPLVTAFIVPKDTSSKRADRRLTSIDWPSRIQAERRSKKGHSFSTKELRDFTRFIIQRAREDQAQEATPAPAEAAPTRPVIARQTLAQRLQQPTLAERIAAAPPPTATPAAPRLKVIDFHKVRHQDRLAIVRPQIQATLKRLQVFVDLENQVNDDNQVNYKKFKAGYERLELLDKGLEELVPATSSDIAKHLQSITWGCAAFKNIEFKHLRRDFDSILKAVADAFDKQYFGWFDVVDSDD